MIDTTAVPSRRSPDAAGSDAAASVRQDCDTRPSPNASAWDRLIETCPDLRLATVREQDQTAGIEPVWHSFSANDRFFVHEVNLLTATGMNSTSFRNSSSMASPTTVTRCPSFCRPRNRLTQYRSAPAAFSAVNNCASNDGDMHWGDTINFELGFCFGQTIGIQSISQLHRRQAIPFHSVYATRSRVFPCLFNWRWTAAMQRFRAVRSRKQRWCFQWTFPLLARATIRFQLQMLASIVIHVSLQAMWRRAEYRVTTVRAERCGEVSCRGPESVVTSKSAFRIAAFVSPILKPGAE